MLGLQELGSGAGLNPVVESHASVGHHHGVVILEDCLGSHGLDAVVGHHRLLVRRREVVLDMALSAAERCRIDGRHVASQGLVDIGVRDHDLACIAGLVAVTGVAADVLLHLGQHFIVVHGIDTHTQVVDQLGEVGGLAGKAVCKGMGTGCGAHILQSVFMTPCTAVFLGKAVAFVDVDQVRILLQIADDRIVVAVGSHGCHDVGIIGSPVVGIDGPVLACGFGGLHILVLDVFPRKRTQGSPVLDVVHHLFVEKAADQQGTDQEHNDGNCQLEVFLLIHPQASLVSVTAAEPTGGRMTFTGHLAAHFPHCVHFS